MEYSAAFSRRKNFWIVAKRRKLKGLTIYRAFAELIHLKIPLSFSCYFLSTMNHELGLQLLFYFRC